MSCGFLETTLLDRYYLIEICFIDNDVYTVHVPTFVLVLKKDFALKMLSMFGTTYICECTFSNLKHIKSKERNRLRDETLGHLLRVSTTEIEVDFTKLSIEKPHPQVSH
ncbi:hypothetical protein QTP88_020219 [Uroleucon formosanum]